MKEFGQQTNAISENKIPEENNIPSKSDKEEIIEETKQNITNNDDQSTIKEIQKEENDETNELLNSRLFYITINQYLIKYLVLVWFVQNLKLKTCKK